MAHAHNHPSWIIAIATAANVIEKRNRIHRFSTYLHTTTQASTLFCGFSFVSHYGQRLCVRAFFCVRCLAMQSIPLWINLFCSKCEMLPSLRLLIINANTLTLSRVKAALIRWWRVVVRVCFYATSTWNATKTTTTMRCKCRNVRFCHAISNSAGEARSRYSPW